MLPVEEHLVPGFGRILNESIKKKEKGKRTKGPWQTGKANQLM